VIGPAGSAKTSGVFAMTLLIALKQFPSDDGVRRTRFAVLRQTYQQLSKNTVGTIRTILGGLVTISDGKPPSGHANFAHPSGDGTTVDIEYVFYAGESPNALNDALGAEFTALIVDEISSLTDEELVLAFASRCGRYPSANMGARNDHLVGVLGATNGPLKSHFLYRWAQGERAKDFEMIGQKMNRPYFKLFRQPAALILNPDGTYDPNPKAENVENLQGGFGYYYNMLTRPMKDIQAYVFGQFADLSAGQVVYKAFRPDLHVVPHAQFMAQWGKMGVIGLSFDFGRTPVCLVWKDLPNGGIVIFEEFVAEGVSVDSLWSNVVRPQLIAEYPRCIVGREGHVTGDPAGADETQAVDISPYQVLIDHGLNIEFPGDGRKDRLEPRIEAVRQRLTRLDGETGRPMIMITDKCVKLIEALAATYVFQEIKGAKGSYSEVPTKSHNGHVSDLANALEYMCLYRRQELEPVRAAPPREAAPALFGG
jgi:hypothetical protein